MSDKNVVGLLIVGVLLLPGIMAWFSSFRVPAQRRRVERLYGSTMLIAGFGLGLWFLLSRSSPDTYTYHVSLGGYLLLAAVVAEGIIIVAVARDLIRRLFASCRRS